MSGRIVVGRVVVVGAGAIGGYFGAHMVRAGVDATLVDAWPEHVETVRRDGLTVQGFSPEDTFTVRPETLHVGDVQGLVRGAPVDIAFIAVKSYDTRWATELILPYLAADGVVVSLQNAVNEPTIAAIAGPERTYGCAIAALACDLVAAGRVVRNSPAGLVSVGSVLPGGTRRADIAALVGHGERAEITDDLIGVKWSKLVVNAMRNGLSAMTGMTGRERDADPVTQRLGIALGAQTVRVARALGHRLVDTGFNFDMLLAADAGDAAALAGIRQRMAEIAGGRNSEQRPSMAQDIRKGRRTETDAINGTVARLGRELGIEVEAHARVHALIGRIERGELTPSPALAAGIV